MFNFLLVLISSAIIGVLFGIYTWQELKKRSNNNVPKRFKKIAVVLGITFGASLYTLVDIVISIVYLFVGI